MAVSAGAIKVINAETLSYTAFSLKETLSLNGFDDEQEEYPGLITNTNGENWLFSLRRLPYPQNNEEIACYKMIDGIWQENGTASLKSDKYENPTAICLNGGEPLVAWNLVSDKNWIIQLTQYKNGKPTKPVQFSTPSGKSVHPKLVEGQNGKIWLTWENYYNGKFSIYISKFDNEQWSDPVQLTPANEVCFDPAVAEGKDGNLYLVYGTTEGFHQNIEMRIFDSSTLSQSKKVPVAIGGGLKNRVNLNTKPALAFDKNERLWISWENNRNTSRLEDGDNFSGDRCCSMVSYYDGKILETKAGRWLFNGKNDHLPTFVKDKHQNLYVFTRCGGDFEDESTWKFRVSYLQSDGWSLPETFLTTNQKGQRSVPSVIFTESNEFCFAWRNEQLLRGKHGNRIKNTNINIGVFSSPEIDNKSSNIKLNPAVVEEHHREFVETKTGGRHRIQRRKLTYKGDEYTLLLGDLHEHSEGSYCWPAGTDGTLHDDYRYALYSEGYDFVGITDHTNTMDEPYWRKSLRIADFYNDGKNFVAIPAAEWTLSPPKGYETIPTGVGHRNVIFSSTKEAEKFIRNNKEIYSEFSPESNSSTKLWQLILEKNIDCVAIPHHVADESHPCDWSVRNEQIEPVVELFQCRGNVEYRGCPRENNVSRHQTTHCDEAFMDYALREKGHKIGFIGSGEHNSMGIGLAALWVKEVSRKGIIEALRARRCFGTTGDKIFMDVQVNDVFMGEVAALNGAPKIVIQAKGQKEIEKVELLRNSRVIQSWKPENGNDSFSMKFIDESFEKENDVLYYYVRVTQKDEHFAWSSPVFVEKN